MEMILNVDDHLVVICMLMSLCVCVCVFEQVAGTVLIKRAATVDMRR